MPCKSGRGGGGLEVDYDPGEMLQLHLGRTSGQRESFAHSHHNLSEPVRVRRVVVHPDYRNGSSDIALIQLEEEIGITDRKRTTRARNL